MTALEIAARRQLAARVLLHQAGPDADAAALAAAARRAYDDLARVVAPLIGQAGLEALTGRALHLAQQEHQWLLHTREPVQGEGPLSQVMSTLERQDPAVAAEAAGTVFTTFTGLLVTFIGESLTLRLLQKAWPDAFSDAGADQTRP